MVIYKNRLFSRLDKTGVKVGEILITKSESEHEFQNFSVHFKRLEGIYKPLGEFNDLASAISFGETFENNTMINDGYQVIELGAGQSVIVYYRQYYDQIRKLTEQMGRVMDGTYDVGESGILISYVRTLEKNVAQKITAVDDGDLISFGNYLLSDERREAKERSHGSAVIDHAMAEVSHADVANWKSLKDQE